MEDQEKLTYLDLEGCFGDLCNLTNGAYLRGRSSIAQANPDAALQKVLAERWAYDDMSEDEPDEEEISSIATATPEPERNHSSYQTQAKKDSETIQIVVSASVIKQEQVNLEQVEVDGVDRPHDFTSLTQFTSGSETDAPGLDDVLLYDNEISNADLINYYIEIARRGANVSLMSVEGGGNEVLL